MFVFFVIAHCGIIIRVGLVGKHDKLFEPEYWMVNVKSVYGNVDEDA